MGVHRAIRGQGQVDDTAYVDPSAYVSSSALVSIKAFVDRGAFIGINAYVGLRTIVGAGAHIGDGAFIGADCIICDKARIADGAVIVDGSTVLSDCCCDGGGSGGDSVPVLTFDSINVVGDKLAAYITTGKKKGTLAYVGNDTFAGQFSVKAYFVLVYGENLTADGLTVVNSPTFGTDGAQWLRQDTVNEQAAQALFWAIDETNGQDENTGWGTTQAAADLVPLKTMAELNRRLFGAVLNATVQFHQLTNVVTFTRLSNVKTRTASTRLIWLGSQTNVFPGGAGTTPVTTYTAANPAGNTGDQLNLAAIPVSWTASGLVNLMVESADGTRTAWVQKDLGGKTARITNPWNPNVTTGNPGAASVFTAGEQVRVVSQTTIPQWPFNSDVRCYMSNNTVSAALVNFVSVIPGPTSALFNGAFRNVRAANLPGTFFQFSSCQMEASLLGGGSWGVNSLGLTGASLTMQGEGAINHGKLDIQGCPIVITEAASFVSFGVDAALGIFDVTTAPMLKVDNDALGRPVRFNSSTPIYGSGNTQAILDVPGGAHVTAPAIANITVATTAVDKLHVAGFSYVLADIPIDDSFNQASISNS